MATNTYNNAVKIAKLCMESMENNLAFAKLADRQYEPMFKDGSAKGGDTINARVPPLGYALRHGATASPQGYSDSYIPITLSQHGADMQFTSKDLALCLEDGEAFKHNVLNPLIAPVANYIDKTGLDLHTSIPQYAGTPGTLPSNIDALFDAKAILTEGAVPDDGSLAAVLHPRHVSGMLKGTTSYFNPAADISEQYKNGNLGRMVGGWKTSVDQNCPTHTVGTIGTSTPRMNGTTADGATQVVTDGWASSAAALNVGDIITIAGVYAVNPVSKASTGALRQFVVTEACSSSGVDMTIKISPAITLTGVNQNVTAVPVNDANIYVYDKNDATYSAKAARTSMLFHPQAFQLCVVDLPKIESAPVCVRVRSKKLGIPIRLIQCYNGGTDQELYRLDVLFGWAVTRPDFAVRVLG